MTKIEGASRIATVDPAAFAEQGYASPLAGIGRERAARFRAVLEQKERRGSGRLPQFFNAKPHLLLPDFWALVHDPAIVDVAAALLGPDVLCYGSSFIIKPPASGRYTAWHQDVTYWGLSEARAITVWVALTPSVPANGCVRVVPGSHTTILEHTDSNDAENLLGRGEKLASDVDEASAVDLVLQPGEISVHHCLIVHGSAPNGTSDRRIGFAARYIPAGLSPTKRKGMTATLVRGRNTGGFGLEEAPTSDLDPAALQRHRAVLKESMMTIFDGKLGQRTAGVAGDPQ